jgi:hypothetical protein
MFHAHERPRQRIHRRGGGDVNRKTRSVIILSKREILNSAALNHRMPLLLAPEHVQGLLVLPLSVPQRL